MYGLLGLQEQFHGHSAPGSLLICKRAAKLNPLIANVEVDVFAAGRRGGDIVNKVADVPLKRKITGDNRYNSQRTDRNESKNAQ